MSNGGLPKGGPRGGGPLMPGGGPRIPGGPRNPLGPGGPRGGGPLNPLGGGPLHPPRPLGGPNLLPCVKTIISAYR